MSAEADGGRWQWKCQHCSTEVSLSRSLKTSFDTCPVCKQDVRDIVEPVPTKEQASHNLLELGGNISSGAPIPKVVVIPPLSTDTSIDSADEETSSAVPPAAGLHPKLNSLSDQSKTSISKRRLEENQHSNAEAISQKKSRLDSEDSPELFAPMPISQQTQPPPLPQEPQPEDASGGDNPSQQPPLPLPDSGSEGGNLNATQHPEKKAGGEQSYGEQFTGAKPANSTPPHASNEDATSGGNDNDKEDNSDKSHDCDDGFILVEGRRKKKAEKKKDDSEKIFGSAAAGGRGDEPIASRTRYSRTELYSGFHEENSVSVTFNVIVPRDYWLWNEDTVMHLRFGDPKLGKWNDVGTFHSHKYLGDNKHWMKCTVNIGREVISHGPIAYKYAVHSPNLKDMSSYPWEYLHQSPWMIGPVNRCLQVPISNKGTFFVFDGMAFPQVQPTSLLQKLGSAVSTVKGWFTGKDKKDIRIPSHDQVQIECLEVYLEKHESILKNLEFSTISKRNFLKCVNGINHVFQQLHFENLCDDTSPSSFRRSAPGLPKVLIKWLFDIAKHLKSVEVGDSSDNGRKMCSILIILCMLFKLSKFLQYSGVHSNEIYFLFSMLQLRPKLYESQAPRFSDLNFLMNFIPDEYQIDVAEALVYFTNRILPIDSARPEWVYVLPLIHIFSKIVPPFSAPKFTSASIKWTDDSIKLFSVNKLTPAKISSIFKENFSTLEPFLLLDPSLLPILVNVCRSEDLPAVFAVIPTYLSAAWLVKFLKIKQKRSFTFDEVKECFTLVQKFTSVVKNLSSSTLFEEVDSTFCEVQTIFVLATQKMYYSTPSTVAELLNSLISLLFYTIVKFKDLCKPDFAAEADRQIEEMWLQIGRSVSEDWIVAHFAPEFGSPDQHGKFRTANEDIEAFELLAAIDCPTTEIQHRWCAVILRDILKKRVDRLQIDLKIELMVILERVENPHHLITDVFVDSVVQSFEEMQNSEHLRRLYDSTQKYRKTVGSVLKKLFSKKFPRGLTSVSISDLLNWESWPVCISIHKSEMRIKSGSENSGQSWFSDDCNMFCSLADSTLMDMIRKIFSGSISLQEMESIFQKMSQVEKLCIASSQDNWDDVKSTLDLRNKECTAFKRHREILGSFCRELEAYNLHVEGLTELIDEIAQDYSQKSLNRLCSITPSVMPSLQFMCFKSAQPLEPILNNYHILSEKYGSDLFKKMWSSELKTAAKTKLPTTFADVVTRVWKPVFTHCCELIESIRSRRIKLRDVDRYFHGFEGGYIRDHLRSLFVGMEACHDRRVSSTEWIRSSVDLMEQYWALCEQAEAANIILKLKESMNLTGSFVIIENVASQVTESMKESSLDQIDCKLIDAKSFLEQMTKDGWKLECLRQFAKCSSIVEWIRKETTEVNDLHKFVSVALHTAAGEGDFSSDRLSHLKIVGSGFGPLIYGLKENSSFESFRLKCEDVWNAVKQTPKLPSFLEACNRELEWYKSVKETQASVEVTSFGQMNNIFNYGCYTVGSDKSRICQSKDQIIHLLLKERKKRLPKQSYTLEELRDLESKLVLITGSKAENRAHVDTFIDTLHSICRIADVLLTLQQVGNVKYTGWTLRVPCSTDRQMIAELQRQAKEMEDELSRWKETVKCRREEFYELNYFNTMQLLALRREFGKLSRGSHIVSPDILALLQSISSQVSPLIVSDTVCQVTNKELAAAHEMAIRDEVEMEGVIVPSHTHEMMSADSSLQLSGGSKPIESPKTDFTKHLPNLTEDDLSETQKEMMANISSRLNCSKQLVLIAFEECPGNENDRYDFENWCSENIGRDIFDECSEDEESEPESASSDSDDSVSEDQHFKYSTSSSAAAFSPRVGSAPKIIVIEKSAKEAIDETNAIVVDLVSAGYTVEQSIDAVDRYGTLEAALTRLEMGEEGEEGEVGTVIPVPYNQQFSREDSEGINREPDDDPTIHADPDAESKYLSLEHLGEVLKHLSLVLPGEVKYHRTFPTEFLKEGYPNLIVVQPDHILRTTLSLYMENHYEHPLPTPEEVLVCNPTTTAEEIELFWMRTIKDPDFRRIFCLVHAEKLSYQVSDLALSSLSKLSQGEQGYRLVIISSNEEEEKSHFISKLHLFRRPFISRNGPAEFQSYLAMKLTKQVQDIKDFSTVPSIPACVVDCQNSCVRIISSNRSGMGKSLYVQRLAEDLAANLNHSQSEATVIVTVPLHGPVVTPDTVLELFMDHLKNPTCCIYHIDIAPNILWEVDTILFSLLILRGLCDSQGRVWRCHPNQLYAVEVTRPNRDNVPQRDKVFFPESRTLTLLDLLPSVSCLSPRRTLGLSSQLQDQILMDDGEFESSSYQRVYQYIRRYTAGQNLDNFSYTGTVEGTQQNCVEQLLR